MRSRLLAAALMLNACSQSTLRPEGDLAVWGDLAAGVEDLGVPDEDLSIPEDDLAGPVFGIDVRPSNPACVAHARPVVDTGVTLQRMWSGIAFNQPIYLTQSPGDNNRWFVVERQGTIRSFATAAAVDADVSGFASVTVNASGEGGLLGFAFHPDWQSKREAYLSYTRNSVAGDPAAFAGCPVGGATVFTSVIARMKSNDNGATLDNTPDEILKVGQPYTNHDGGNIQFSPVDKMLYIGFGDGGSGDDPCASGQSLTTMLGKILRIDVNAGAGAYLIPADNPFYATPNAAKEIWAYGQRNPWRWSFDPVAGDLWLGDVGQGTWEEIDRIVKGGNYGWKTCEGFHRRGSTTTLCNTPGVLDPVVEHGRTEARSITGGYVYRGSSMPSLAGTYIYGDYATGNIWALTYDLANQPVPKVIATVAGSTLVSFAQGNDGEVYTVQISGVISKLGPSASPMPDTFPKLLSQTGCVDAADPTKPAAGLIPYQINSPLWSDGAAKERFLAIPDGATIGVGADGDWDLPIGSVAVKTFSLAGKRVETRLFMRHDDGGWAGYTYEWNDAETEATLLSAGKLRTVGTQVWSYPSRTQCLQCHSLAAGGTIGLESAQLDRDAFYPSTNRTSAQLATLEHIGLFSAPLGAGLPRLPDPAGGAPVEERARSYLHANCSHCHRPSGGGQGTMDLRFAQAFKDTNTCSAPVTQGSVGGATQIIVPGSPSTSVLSLRFHAADSKRMPPVAVSLLDATGSAAIDDWITSLTMCP